MLKIDQELLEWCSENFIKIEQVSSNKFLVPSFGTIYLLDGREEEPVLSTKLSLVLTEEEYEEIGEYNPDFIVFKFGNRFYYTNTIHEQKLEPLTYVGEPDLIFGPIDFPYLGIHSGYELLSGSRRYKDYIKKAKWLGSSVVGVCEESTLAGVVAFQEQCEKAGVKGIVGELFNLSFKGHDFCKVKFYVKNVEGWNNLLRIHRVMYSNNKCLDSEELTCKLLEGIVVVITPQVTCSLKELYFFFKQLTQLVYFQLDFTEWESQEKDLEVIESLQEFLDNRNYIQTVLISDYYYLEKRDSHIRKQLGAIDGGKYRASSSNLYLKNIDEYLLEGIAVIEEEDLVYELKVSAIQNTIDIFSNIEFKILTGNFYLPKFPIEGFNTPEGLLLEHIQKGMEEKVIPFKTKEQILKYWERVDTEFSVISKGGFIDYFLILIDLYKFADDNGIWYGIGRGSAAGCLISYLTGIVGIDPIEYGLFFERFLNEGRIGKSLPDIDTDWQGSRRQEIKRYIETKYGEDQVVSIGTYGTFRLRNAIRDLARIKGVDQMLLNIVTKSFSDSEQKQGRDHFYWELFTYSSSKKFRDFMNEYPDVLEDIYLILMQPKNSSIHAAGIVILPSEFGTSYEQLPVKVQDGQLVSEWEGSYIDEAGFLKIDVLGIKQLDKLAEISKLIQERYGILITFRDIDLDDSRVYDKFKGGWNEDVFQLGGLGLKGYSKELQPDNIEDIIATVALYRPGPIESGTHIKYIRRKNGIEDSISYPGIEDITKKTYGLVVYQEQVMQICQALADFTLVEADDIRKALGKMKPELVKEYRDTFLERSIRKGYPKSSMESLWAEMEAFAKYAFNRSHAACYAITGYYCQWFKVHYPLEFWTVSLQWSTDDERPNRITEIYRTSDIRIKTVDINYSSIDFRSEKEKNTIYWSLLSVKFVGEKVVQNIFEIRDKTGLFYSFEEFLERIRGYSAINKRAIANLIICGAFDDIEKIEEPSDRYRLLEFLYRNDDLKEEYREMGLMSSHDWTLVQYNLTGFGFFNFEELILKSSIASLYSKYSVNQEILSYDLESEYKEFLVCGILVGFVERSSKNGKFCELQIRDNTELLYITVWSDKYDVSEMNSKNLGKTIIFYGQGVFDSYKKTNVLHSSKKTKFEII